MNTTDANAAAPAPRGTPDGAADPGEPPSEPATGADCTLGPRPDRAAAARLRDESRRSRARIVRRLTDAGHLSPSGAPTGDAPADRPDHIDAWRDLSDLLDENVAFLEQIEALHDLRAHSGSPRERQVATRVLAEALHRIVAGYSVDDDPPHRPVMVARRVDEGLGRLCRRLAGRGPRRQAPIRWWARNGRWAGPGLALVAGLLLVGGRVGAAALVVAARAALSCALFVPARRVGPRRRLLGDDHDWAASIGVHLGDAAVVAGLGLGVHLAGQTPWGAALVFTALFRLIAASMRLAGGQHGLRMPRLWLDRVVTTIGLPVGVAAAAVASPGAAGAGLVPVAAAVAAGHAAVGLVDVCRIAYYGWCRRRLLRRAAAAGDAVVPAAIVTHTSDAIVVNLTGAGRRAGVLDDAPGERTLRAVGDGRAGGRPATRRARRRRPPPQ
ncbi:MAG TPA: hypothetical protein VFZ77_24575 [Acidimicrobiales bacterium]